MGNNHPNTREMEVGGGLKVAVFIQGRGDGEDVWYRVEVEQKSFIPKDKRKMVRKRISPVAAISWKRYGYEGSWDVIGDDIYWIGGHYYDDKDVTYIPKELLKHNITNSSSDPRVWETVSNRMKTPRGSPLLTAVGGKKLYVLLGVEYCSSHDNYDDEDFERDEIWDKCGEVYDIEKGTWELLKPQFDDFLEHETFHTALVMKGDDDDEEPTAIAFCDLYRPLLFFNFREQELHTAPDSWISGWNRAPVGSQGCNDTFALHRAISNFDRVFDNHTFYWFASDLRLYGYGIDCQSWLVSPSLEHKFHNLQCPPDFTMLVRLGNEKLLVIVDEPGDRGCFTMATLVVEREKDEQGCYFLSVSVKSLQAFSLDYSHSFHPSGAKAVKLTNTTAMHGQHQVVDNIRDVYPVRKTEKIDSRTKALILAIGGLGILLFKSLQRRK